MKPFKKKIIAALKADSNYITIHRRGNRLIWLDPEWYVVDPQRHRLFTSKDFDSAFEFLMSQN